MGIMLSAATLMVLFCKLTPPRSPTCRPSSPVCPPVFSVLGVAWLGNVFVKGNMVEIQAFAGDPLSQYSFGCWPWCCSSPCCSTRKAPPPQALMPAALALRQPAGGHRLLSPP